ncbi:MAG: hypothetical protein KGY49_12610 [Wenzhouxiangellaceae bacterium]|nr:hypothetical protein [Wenzhouxiangellaceae bacterium]
MKKSERSQKLMVVLGPSTLVLIPVLVVFLFAEWRTENHIQKAAEVCERAGMGLEIRRINTFGSVESRCIPRADR